MTKRQMTLIKVFAGSIGVSLESAMSMVEHASYDRTPINSLLLELKKIDRSFKPVIKPAPNYNLITGFPPSNKRRRRF